MKATRELNRELPLLYKRGKIEHRDVIFIISKIREILETKGIYKEKFPELNLFCNWCLHTKLSQSKTIYRALLNTSKVLSNTMVPPDSNPHDINNDFLEVSCNILNIPKLRKGLKVVLEEQNIDSTIARNKDWWDAFLTVLLEQISEKPIEFPQNVVDGTDTKSKAYPLYKEILALPPHGYDHNKIKCMRVINDEGKFSEEKSKSIFALKFTTVSDRHLVVQLYGNESIDEFSS